MSKNSYISSPPLHLSPFLNLRGEVWRGED
jgi:hypothetical protein